MDWTGQYRTGQDRTGQDSTVQYSTVQYSTVQYLFWAKTNLTDGMIRINARHDTTGVQYAILAKVCLTVLY